MVANLQRGAAAPLVPIYGETYKRTVLGLLLVAYTLNFIDRTIISTIGQAIKVDLVLSDTELGVLGGLAFDGVFSSPYFMRQFGLDLATVGLVGGLVGGISTGAGTLIGGYLTDWLSRRTLRAYALVPAMGLFIAAPTYAFAYLQEDWHYAVAFMLIPGVFHYAYLGPTFGVIQNVTELRRRATTTAVMFFFLNLIGLGGGPPFVGWLIDQLTNFHFTHSDALGPIASTIATFLPTATEPAAASTFLQSCPGGIARDGANADLVAACARASAIGTRQGILVTLLIFAWSGFHYLLGSIGLAKLLRENQEERGG